MSKLLFLMFLLLSSIFGNTIELNDIELNDIFNNNPTLRRPEETNKPFIFSCCIDDSNNLLTSSYNNQPKNRYNYFFNCKKEGCKHTLTTKYFCTKKIVKDNGKYSFNN